MGFTFAAACIFFFLLVTLGKGLTSGYESNVHKQDSSLLFTVVKQFPHGATNEQM